MPGEASERRAPSRVLIVRLGAVGDVIRSLPALEALRALAPRATIGWAVERGAASILEGQPSIDTLHVVPRGIGRSARAAWRELRRSEYDTVLDLHGVLRSGVLSRMTRAPNRLAYGPPVGRERSHWFASRTVPSPAEPWRVGHFLGLVTALGLGEALPSHPITIPLRDGEAENVRGWLSEIHEAGRPLVAIHPGASAGAGWKRWPPERYRLVAERLAAVQEATVVATWGPGEEELAQAVAEGSTHPVQIPPLLNLRELAELYRRADLFLGGDTGPMHLAAAVGTRVLCLMGGSDAARNRPVGEGHVVLAAGPPLRPRPWNRSTLRERVLAIPAHDVYDEAARLLEEAP